MKEIFCVVGLTLMLTTCNLPPAYDWQVPEVIYTIEDAQKVMKRMEYKTESEPQMPEDTYILQSGDCDSLSGLFASMLKYNLGYKDVKLVGCIYIPNNKRHMVVYADGNYYQGDEGHLIKTFDDLYIITNTMSYETYLILAKIL